MIEQAIVDLTAAIRELAQETRAARESSTAVNATTQQLIGLLGKGPAKMQTPESMVLGGTPTPPMIERPAAPVAAAPVAAAPVAAAPVAAAPVAAAPVAAAPVTEKDVRAEATKLAIAITQAPGGEAQLFQLLQSMGVARVSACPTDKLTGMVENLRKLHAMLVVPVASV